MNPRKSYKDELAVAGISIDDSPSTFVKLKIKKFSELIFFVSVFQQ